MIRIGLEGFEDLQKNLMDLPLRYQKKALYNAFKAGADVVASEAQAQASSKGLHKKIIDAISAGKPTKRQRHSRETVVVVALKMPVSRLAHILEFGTARRFRNSGKSKRRGKKGDHAGGYTGYIAPKPFLRPALDLAAEKAIETIARISRENIERIAAQLAAGQKVSLRRSR